VTTPAAGADVAARKAALRRELLARRRALAGDAAAAAGPLLLAALAPLLLGGAPVALYASTGTEPPTGPLLEALGPRALLPVLRDDGDLDWTPWQGRLVPGARGTLQPAAPLLGPDAVGTCGLVVVPALAVDARGARLGRGGGSYDRALARARAPVVALLHDGELLDAVPTEPHDRPVDAAVTPSAGLVRCSARLAP
jgi:5-formyltetrahydrofolate cyclo-ligase